MPFRTGRIQETPPVHWQVCHTLLEIFTPYKCGEVNILPWMIIPCFSGKDSEKTASGRTRQSSAHLGRQSLAQSQTSLLKGENSAIEKPSPKSNLGMTGGWMDL